MSFRAARWSGFGPKVVVVSDIQSRKYSVEIALTADDELRIMGESARNYAIAHYNGRSGGITMSTRSDDRLRWVDCQHHGMASLQIVGLSTLDTENDSRWCISVQPVRGSGIAQILREFADRFTSVGTYVLSDTSALSIGDAIGIVMSADDTLIVGKVRIDAAAQWRNLGPKIVVITNLVECRWALHVAFTDEDELRIMGESACKFVMRFYRRFSDIAIHTSDDDPTDPQTKWATGHTVNAIFKRTDIHKVLKTRWIVFICRLSNAAMRFLDGIERLMKDSGMSLGYGDISEVRAIAASSAT